MKKYIFAILILLIPIQVSAFEDYVILSDTPVNFVYSKDETIVSILPFFTIDNSKNMLILKSKSEGATDIVFETNDGIKTINVTVNENQTNVSETEGISAFTLDFTNSLPERKKPVLREDR